MMHISVSQSDLPKIMSEHLWPEGVSQLTFLKQTKYDLSNQWRSKACEGPWFNSNLGVLPFTSPSLPSPFPPLPQPSPSPKRPRNPAKGLGERCKLPQRGVGRSPSQNRISCILALKSVMRHLMATILMIFLSVLPKKFSVAHYSGPQELGGPGSLNP